MTNEPVAYWHIPQIKNEEIFVSFSPSKTSHFEDIPLYTSEDLHPRVKMTQKQSDDFKSLHAQFDLLSDGINAIYEIEHLPMKSWIVNGKLRENEMLIAGIWGEYDPDNPEETIEIVPTMKWFVRSKEQYQPDMDQGISESGYLYLMQGNFYKVDYYLPTPFKDDAQQFDTKEEAEKWENPLTEAVLLPVEDE